ncbi:peptidyl-prolyl cis-trans isomerase FKBP4 [Eurytemora carolleeae]|uniref:peptidyl-prolyl cis-trans isomerase FKBP4 n=1 Tax=Eurytemora carolleeae TaxID=1294199 RepID=UPI000C765095|nr:peptidyl-prolyl cis-trans isomerase FKBP4 [Eurytemora carolleeae]|eukprot:XP_023330039.1 peptidyl-prolyl cis-trans isomerase FKBP4-like [Eurytemora affinis]
MSAVAAIVPGGSAVDISPLKDGGVLKEITTPGSGDELPLTGDKVYVHYVGKLTDGSQFDSSRDRGEKFSFSLGKGEVIKGWDIGVATMKVGERAVFFIKSEYGYGPTGSPPKIPGGATLVFDVELFSFEGEDITKDKDGGVVKRILVAGDGYDTPNDGALVDIMVTGQTVSGKVFDTRCLEFEIGEGPDHNLPRGVELALEKMKKGEEAEITIKPEYGFGIQRFNHQTFTELSGETELKYKIKLTKFERSKESWQLDADQKVEQAKMFKEKGTKYYKAEKYEMAASRYNKVIDFLEHEISLKDEAEVERKSLLEAGRMNLALCKMKLQDWIEARNLCTKVSLARKGKDFTFVYCQVLLCEQKIKTHRQKEKKTFANMFDKFAAIDQKREETEKMRKPDTMNNIDEWNSGARNSVPATDPNSIKVVGDVDMNLDINQAIQEDQEHQQENGDGTA